MRCLRNSAKRTHAKLDAPGERVRPSICFAAIVFELFLLSALLPPSDGTQMSNRLGSKVGAGPNLSLPLAHTGRFSDFHLAVAMPLLQVSQLRRFD